MNLNTTHIRLILVGLAIVAASLLVGCVDPVKEAADRQRGAEGTINELVPACRDHVQYLVTPYSNQAQMVTPRLHTDGYPYTC